MDMDGFQSEVFKAFRSVNIPEDAALAATVALSRPVMSADITTLKADVTTLKADVATLKADVTTLKADVTTLKADVATLKADTTSLKVDTAVLKWMMGFVLAFQLAQLFLMFRSLSR